MINGIAETSSVWQTMYEETNEKRSNIGTK